ncbi:hypothetical protein B0H16DRAFT_1891740 [Mycena metata]|uniref:F-box domain-containing protein n=1 Tax=Mycena metata TaxID=1033252 RepID=A0AAD7I9M6_9AGAR|nr:hypothetical protein B0H16DRAFT_1891740 [Mycena metata]
MSVLPCVACGASARQAEVDLISAVGARQSLLLNSNVPPEASDLASVQTTITETDAQLANLDAQIARRPASLRDLEERRTMLWNYRTRTHAILSPLRRVPPELLGHIFLCTLPGAVEALKRGRIDMADSPWLLTQISSHWRAVALSIPSLWSNISIDYMESFHNASTYSLPLVETQIQRSRELRIHFYGCEEMDATPQTAMLQLLSHHSLRWRDLSLGITSAMAPFLPSLRDRLPALKTLWIHWNIPQSHPAVTPLDCFQTASSLVNVGIHNSELYVPILFPAHALTRYELNAPWDFHLGILNNAPSLVEARIIIYSDQEPWPVLAQPILLPHLRRLYLSHPEFADSLVLPALEELAGEVPNLDMAALLRALVERSSCTLRRLASIRTVSAQAIIELLRRFPSITELAISMDSMNHYQAVHSLIAALTSLSGDPSLAPGLNQILFGCQYGTDIDYEVYLDMLKSRWNAENCDLKLAALLIDSGKAPDQATLDGLAALRRDGLYLSVLTGSAAGDEMNLWSYATDW